MKVRDLFKVFCSDTIPVHIHIENTTYEFPNYVKVVMYYGQYNIKQWFIENNIIKIIIYKEN